MWIPKNIVFEMGWSWVAGSTWNLSEAKKKVRRCSLRHVKEASIPGERSTTPLNMLRKWAKSAFFCVVMYRKPWLLVAHCLRNVIREYQQITADYLWGMVPLGIFRRVLSVDTVVAKSWTTLLRRIFDCLVSTSGKCRNAFNFDVSLVIKLEICSSEDKIL